MSFQKKNKSIEIPGTKVSHHNNQLLVSTGVPSLDYYLGGGIAVGSSLLIEEDLYGHYSKLLLKLFAAEGILAGHDLFNCSLDSNPECFLEELPEPIHDEPRKQTETGDNKNMKIAWRYNKLATSEPQPAAKFGNYFDLSKNMSSDMKNRVNIRNFSSPLDNSNYSSSQKSTYTQLLHSINTEITQRDLSTHTDSKSKNIYRIVLHSLGSPQWGTDATGKTSLLRFLYSLRAILRSSYSVAVISIPTHLFHDIEIIDRLENLSDTAIHMESFSGSNKEKNPLYKEYHGLLNIKKLSRLNTIQCHLPETLDLAFKLKRKKFVIEKLHLPPDLSETASRGINEEGASKSSPCNTSNTNSKYDF